MVALISYEDYLRIEECLSKAASATPATHPIPTLTHSASRINNSSHDGAEPLPIEPDGLGSAES
jgi:hypothetical protein